MNIRLFTLFILLTLLSCSAQETPPPALPNFIIIFADDLGYGDLSCYGHPTIKTPHLDQMAEEGMRFTQFYVASSICTPSRAGLLTGKLPVRSGMYGNRSVIFPDNAGGLQPEEITIAEALKSKDYNTACIGKWHLGHQSQYLPNNQGFDYFYGILHSNDMRPEGNWDYARSTFPPLMLMENREEKEVLKDQSHLTALFTDKAIEFVEKNNTDPFFLFLSHTAPHTPLHVDDKNKGRSKRGRYGDVVEVLDDNVGKILTALKKIDLDKNTFVIFTSDNGPWGWAGIDGGSQGLLRGKKSSPWEGGYRVPAIAWMPGSIKEKTTCNAIGSTLDLFPTFLSMAGINGVPEIILDGYDISNTFFENKVVRELVHYYRQDELVALRKGSWKIFIKDPNPWNDDYSDQDLPLLFNIEQDPSERFNIAEDHPKIISELSQLAQEHIAKVVKGPSQLEAILPQYQAAYDEYNKKK